MVQMTTVKPLTAEPARSSGAELEDRSVDERSLQSLGTYLRLAAVSEDLTQDLLHLVDDVELASNVPFMVLMGIHLDGPMRPTALAALAGVTSGGLTAALERLEASSLVTREFGLVPGDRRAVVVRLTAKGEAVALETAALLEKHVERLLRDLGSVLEQRQGPSARHPAAQGAGAVEAEAARVAHRTAPDLTGRSRESMDIFLRIARLGEALIGATMARLHHREFHLNATQPVLYWLLVQGAMRPSDIAALTGLSSGGVSGLLERLERAGLITRAFGQVPGDRRGVVVRLTEEGYQGMLVLAELRRGPVENLLNELAPTIQRRTQSPAPDGATA
jgi:DNA-binding MarR family transcriptional regulator